MPLLSICIVNYNTRDLLERCLTSIYADVEGLSVEVIVVDNASSDGSRELIMEKFPETTLIPNSSNLHFTKAMNQALRHACGQFVLLLNPDTEIPPGTLGELFRFLQARPAVGAMGCRLLNPDSTLQRTGNHFPSLGFLLFETLGLDVRYPRNPVYRWNTYADWSREEEREIDAISGACLMVRRQVVEQVGLLDEGFQMYFEEVDWCQRIRAAGWRIGFDPAASIIHHGEQSVKQLPRLARDEIFWSSLLYYTRKYHGVIAERALRTILTARRWTGMLARFAIPAKPSSREGVAESLGERKGALVEQSGMRYWQSTGLLAVANALSMGLSFVTAVLVAREFGTTAEMDAYTVAISIPESLQYVLMLSTLSLIFTPLFIDFRTRYGEREAWEIALSLLIVVGCSIAVLIPLLALGAPLIVRILAPGFSDATRDLTAGLTVLTLPTLFYYGTAGLLLGISFAYYDFRVAIANTVLLALFSLLSFFLFVGVLKLGVRGLILGRLTTLLTLEGFLLWGTLRLKRHLPIRLRVFHPELRYLASFLPVYVVGALSGQISLAINRMFASTLGTGSVAAWGYGQRFADIPLTIIGGAFGTTFLPTFATQVSEDQKPAASRTWSEIIPRISFLLVPVAVILIVLRVPLIAFVFERGSFDQNSTLLSSLVLAGLALGLPLRAVGGLVMRGLPAFKTRSVPALLSLISTGSNIIFDFALIGVLGLFGIALSASLADMLFAMVGAIFFVRWLGSVSVTRVARSLAKIVVAGIGMGLVTFGMITQGVYPHVDSRLASLLLQLGVPLAAAAVSYGLLAYALRIEESRAVLDHLTGRIAQWLQQRPIQPEG